MNAAMETILSRTSIRQFTGELIPRDNLELILRAAMAAPSAVNVQPWKFLAVTERKILDQLCRDLPYAKMLDRASAAFIVCGLPGKDDRFAPRYWVFDCSAASENILLAAHSLGYGAVWTAVYPEPERVDSVRRICHIPEEVIPLNVIPIGVPVRSGGEPVDKFSDKNILWESYL